ncbi:hypothetical protein ACFQ9Z_12395 [Streptomyces sp. NPDC056580]|uniref:hypothetical protein n=1 Tax=Streptomyces sp. NPDC056580 TaxID=3345872 RepID=UPI0036885394
MRRHGISTASTAVLCGTLFLAACGPGGADGADGPTPARIADADLVVRTHRGGTEDTVAVYRGSARDLLGGRPAVTFSTSEFLAG